MTQPKMTLPNGDVLRVGDYGIMRNGNQIGPITMDGHGYWPFEAGGWTYRADGSKGFELGETRLVDIVAKWTDASEETPILWSDMTPEEKGALLLAHHEGMVIENTVGSGSWGKCKPSWCNNIAYRIKPEPKVETVVLSGRQLEGDWSFGTGMPWKLYTHRITLTIRNGKVDPVAQVEVLE